MDGRFSNPFVREQEEPENTVGSTFSGVVAADGKTRGAVSSPKRRRDIQKRVVSVPIGDTDGWKMKGEGAPPPSDSWAWRKYGQKPIKGSPYPRGYYRCSSCKGCPARKQVERSRMDPSMLMITYACDHNHPFPVPKNPTNTICTTKLRPEEPAVFSNAAETEPEEKFGDLGEDSFSLKTDGDCYWFSDVASSSPAKETVLESPICEGNSHADLAVLFPMREEDESLFADLGELPECSVVFRRGILDTNEESRQCTLRAATWCGSTG